jgi:hypothetical protein
MAVAFPIAGVHVQFQRATHRFGSVESNGDLGKIRPGGVIPHTELHEARAASVRGDELPPEIPGEPSAPALRVR